MEEVPSRTSLAPFASPCFVLLFNRVETDGLLDYTGEGGESGHHVHCTVEPSPGHIRCQLWCCKSCAVRPFLHVW